MEMSPVIAVHLSAATTATLVGPVALWARRSREQRPRLHRAFGYAWVTLMLVAAVSALFIRDFKLPNINGYTPVHLLVPATFVTSELVVPAVDDEHVLAGAAAACRGAHRTRARMRTVMRVRGRRRRP